VTSRTSLLSFISQPGVSFPFILHTASGKDVALLADHTTLVISVFVLQPRIFPLSLDRWVDGSQTTQNTGGTGAVKVSFDLLALSGIRQNIAHLMR
jgi:hypothetical protein